MTNTATTTLDYGNDSQKEKEVKDEFRRAMAMSVNDNSRTKQVLHISDITYTTTDDNNQNQKTMRHPKTTTTNTTTNYHKRNHKIPEKKTNN